MLRSGPTILAVVTTLLSGFAIAGNLAAQETRVEPAPATPPGGSAGDVTRVDPALALPPAEGSRQVTRVDPSPASPPSPAYAQEAQAVDSEPAGIFGELQDALLNGKVSFNLRALAEVADIDGLKKSQAYTERLRLGYGTKSFHGLKLFVEFEDTRSADDDLYNAAGLNGEPDKTVIADPENTEMNQAFAHYTNDYIGAKVGRQRLILDDARFVGNVGWRQNEQTFDAFTLTSSWIKDVDLLYSYVDDVNRIFGPDARRDFKSDSHLLHASHKLKANDLDLGQITAFAYFLDFTNSDANSSDTYGARYTGKTAIDDDLSVAYAASYAYQQDAASNPTNYDADYLAAELSVAKKGWGSVGGGYELLGSDDETMAFRTPLATLHLFQGWADQFLATPAAGIEDVYTFVGASLPFGIKSKIVYHWLFSHKGSSDYGEEFDAVVSKSFSPNFAVLAKMALYDGRKRSSLLNAAQRSNIQRYWVQAEMKF